MTTKRDFLLFIKALFIAIAGMFFNASSLLATIKTSNDSILSPLHSNISFEKQKLIIQQMDEVQLHSLVDEVFGMDSVSPQLVTYINMAICDLNCKKEENENVNFPSSELYSMWESEELFPEADKLKTKNDTTFNIVVQTQEHNKYTTPFNGPITSNYGWRGKRMHKGIDIDLIKGDSVVSAFDGMVRVAKKDAGFGNVVIVRHYNGLETVYAHLSKLKVKTGDVIKSGDLVGLGGNTGHSKGSHLHFEIRIKGVALNPKCIVSFSNQSILSEEFRVKKNKSGLTAYPLNSKFYTVEKGDTIYEIAKRFGTTTSIIKEMNNLYGKNVYFKVGQKICVAR